MTIKEEEEKNWSKDHLAKVQYIYALIIGGICVLIGGGIIIYGQKMALSDMNTIVAGSSIILLGLVASLPNTFMPIISALIRKLPGNGKSNGTK